ncbi:hypothetical protein PIB30_096415, partial [Stylosanthes scabra]|nr:hypothetical protein [Stylosanthes scabra]
MATDMQRLIGTSEDDDEEIEMDVKEEDDGDEDEEENGGDHGNASDMVGIDGGNGLVTTGGDNRFQQQQQFQDQVGTPGGSARRCRPLEEKERTKLRERRRRAITAKILAGLRRHGNYNLRGQRPTGGNSAVVTPSSPVPSQPTPSASIRGVASGYRSSLEYNTCQTKGVFMPTPSPYDLSSSSRSQTSMVGDGELQRENQPLVGSGSMDTVNEKQ